MNQTMTTIEVLINSIVDNLIWLPAILTCVWLYVRAYRKLDWQGRHIVGTSATIWLLLWVLYVLLFVRL